MLPQLSFESNFNAQAMLHRNSWIFWLVFCVLGVAAISKDALDGQLTHYLDTAIDPCDNFYDFACGQYNRRHPIASYDSQSRTFSVLADQIRRQQADLLETMALEADNQLAVRRRRKIFSSNYQDKARQLYGICMEAGGVDDGSVTELKAIINGFGGFPVLDENWNDSQFDWAATLGQMQRVHNNILIGLRHFPDDALNNIVRIQDPELGMPSANYYAQLEEDAPMTIAYLRYLRQVMTLMGATAERADAAALDMLQFERQLVEIFQEETVTMETFERWESSDSVLESAIARVVATVLDRQYDATKNFTYQESFIGEFFA